MIHLYQVDQKNEKVGLNSKLQQERIISGTINGKLVFTIPGALSFLAFVLIYFPCIGVIATIKNESGKLKWALFMVIYICTDTIYNRFNAAIVSIGSSELKIKLPATNISTPALYRFLPT